MDKLKNIMSAAASSYRQTIRLYIKTEGYDFLGIHFGETPKMSKTILENHRSKLALRYAQGASEPCIGRYIERWTTWCMGLLKCCTDKLEASSPIENKTLGHSSPR